MTKRALVQLLIKEAGNYRSVFPKRFAAPEPSISTNKLPPPLPTPKVVPEIPQEHAPVAPNAQPKPKPNIPYGQLAVPGVLGAAYLGSHLLGGGSQEQEGSPLLDAGSNFLGQFLGNLANRPTNNFQPGAQNYETPENFPMPLNKISSLGGALKTFNSIKEMSQPKEEIKQEKKEPKITIKDESKNKKLTDDPKVQEYLKDLLR